MSNFLSLPPKEPIYKNNQNILTKNKQITEFFVITRILSFPEIWSFVPLGSYNILLMITCFFHSIRILTHFLLFAIHLKLLQMLSINNCSFSFFRRFLHIHKKLHRKRNKKNYCFTTASHFLLFKRIIIVCTCSAELWS